MEINWILCDYGGVLADDHIPWHEATIAAAFRCDRQMLREAITERSPQGQAVRLDLVSERVFWESVAERITGSKLLPAAETVLTEMWSKTYAPRLEVFELLTRYSKKGVQIGIATNVDRYREKYLRDAIQSFCFDATIFGSWRLRSMKPATEYFEAVTKEIGLTDFRTSIVFFDDQLIHVNAAKEAGWSAFQYTTPSVMRSDILSLARDTMKG